jgi:hypothetical protein
MGSTPRKASSSLLRSEGLKQFGKDVLTQRTQRGKAATKALRRLGRFDV